MDFGRVVMAASDSVAQPAIEEELSSRLDAFRGKWVAVDGDEVVASGDSAREVLDAARNTGHTDPLVFRVSVVRDRLAFF